MNDSTPAGREKDYLAKSLDVAIRLTLIAVVILSSFRIFGPFLPTLVWGGVIAIALYPVFEKLRSWVGGRAKLASGIFIVVAVGAILVPTVLLGGSLLDGTVRIVKDAEEGTLDVPAPTEQVREWPVIGEKAYLLWESAHRDLQGTMHKMQPQIGNIGRSIVGAVSSLGGALIMTILALIIAGVFMSTAEGAGRASKVIARRLGGEDGPRMVDTAVGTIRSVVKGVILVALIQGLLAAIGLAIAKVPALGLWSVLVVVVAIIQLPPILILGPIAAWVFANGDSTGISVFFLIWSLAVSGADGLLKPMLLGRGVEVPMLVILIGAIGGMLSAGVMGLFIGPVILAIAWELAMMWVEESREPAPAGE
jgi:predicted PurR-regulated permease PerM